jgi:hypothetical protein
MKRLTITAVGLVLLLAACSGEETAANLSEIGDGLAAEKAAAAQDVDEARAATTPEGGVVELELAATEDRKVIRHAQLQLEADDTREAFDRIVTLVEASGGFVATADVLPVEGEEDQPEVVMTLRVPTAELSATMSSIKGLAARVLSESQDAQDVTEQYVDLEAQLTNLQALEVELRALLTEVREQPNADPDKLLRVFNEISAVRGQIEQIQGQIEYLDDVVTMASLDVSLSPTPSVVPIVEDTWKPVEVARDALRSLVVGLQGIADWAINFGLYTLPMLILTLGPILVIGFLIYRRWRKRQRPAPPAPLGPATTEA